MQPIEEENWQEKFHIDFCIIILANMAGLRFKCLFSSQAIIKFVY